MTQNEIPAPETTIVNVKSMPVHAWNLAKAAATKRGETLAEWLARAIYLQAQHDAGEMPRPPGDAGPAAARAPSITPEQVEALARAAHLMAEGAGVPIQKAAARQVMALATQHARAARGLPEPALRRGRRPVLALEADNPGIPADNLEARNR